MNTEGCCTGNSYRVRISDCELQGSLSVEEGSEVCGKEVALVFRNVLHFLPKRAHKTLHRLVNVCITSKGNLLLNTYFRRRRNVDNVSMLLTGDLCGLRPQSHKVEERVAVLMWSLIPSHVLERRK